MSTRIATISSDKRYILQSWQIYRMPIFGSTWTKIRIGIRVALPSAIAVTGSPKLIIGVCSGATNGIGSLTTQNFIGVQTDQTTTPVWSLSGTPGSNAYHSNMQMRVVKRIGTTRTVHSSNLTTLSGMNLSAEESRLNAIIVQIEKGSPNYTLRVVNPINATGAQANCTLAKLEEFMALDAALSGASSVLSGYSLAESNNTMAMDESQGDLDHINIAWDKTTVECHISDVNPRMVA